MIKERLRSKTFKSNSDMLRWANSRAGTDYVFSIVKNGDDWIIYYVK